MDTDVLKAFVEVVQRSSFAAAARQLGADPSAVSRAIAGLERELGIRLFQRTTRLLVPTQDGAALYARIRPLVDALDAAVVELRDRSAEPSGILRLTASVAFGQTCVMPMLPELRDRHPALEFDLLFTDEIVDLIGERIDLAIRLVPPTDSTLVITRLMAVRHRVCASPGWLARHGVPATPQSLEGLDCLRFPYVGYRSRWHFRDAAGAVSEVDVHGPIVASTALALRRAALDGLGPALLPDWLIGSDLQRRELVDLYPAHETAAGEFDAAAWLVYPSRTYVPLKVRAMIDFVKARFSG